MPRATSSPLVFTTENETQESEIDSQIFSMRNVIRGQVKVVASCRFSFAIVWRGEMRLYSL